MTVEDEIKESLEKKDLESFKEIITRPKIYINDLFNNGVLHYVLENYKDVPLSEVAPNGDLRIEFIKALLELKTVDINRLDKNGLPPLLCTEREDIQDIMLTDLRIGVNRKVDEKSILLWAVENVKIELLKKLIVHPEIDMLSRDEVIVEKIAVIQSMRNPDMFKLFLESPKMNINGVGWFKKTIPLVEALKNKWYEAAMMLLEKGADINLKVEETGLTIAETIIQCGNPLLITFLLEHSLSGNVKDTSHLIQIALLEKRSNFTYSSMERDLHLIETLIEKKCKISESTIDELSNSLDMLNIVVTHLDEELNIENNKLLIQSVLFSDNIELINKMMHTEYVLTHKIEVLECLKDIKNPLVIDTILSREEFLGDNIAELLKKGDYTIFMRLLTKGKTGIEKINYLLDSTKVQLSPIFPPVDILIRSGVPEQIALAKKLIEHHNVMIQVKEEMKYLVDNKIIDVIEVILKKNTVKDIYSNILNISICINLILLLKDDIDILIILIGKLCINSDLQRILARSLSELSKTKPELVFRIMDMRRFRHEVLFRNNYFEEENKTLLTSLIDNLPNNEDRDRLATFLEDNDLIDDLAGLNLLDIAIEDGNEEILNFLIKNEQFIVSVPIAQLIQLNNQYFMFENFNRICNSFDTYKYDFQGVVSVLLEHLETHEDVIMENDIFDIVIQHPQYDLESLEEDANGTYRPQLELLIMAIHTVTKDDSKEKLLRVFKSLLEFPRLSLGLVNQINDNDEYGGVEETVLDMVSVYGGGFDDFEFSENYDATKPYHAILKMLLEHPQLNITDHIWFISTVIKRNYSNLFTHIISRPELDIDACHLLGKICYLGNDTYLNVLLTMQNFDINYRNDDDLTALHLAISNSNDDCATLLIEDPRIDLSILLDGKNYAEYATEHDRQTIIQLLRTSGIRDVRAERMEQEAAEYDARMAEMGRPKQARLKSTLDIYDAILKEREDPDAELDANITLFSKSLCPFCLVFLEKEDPRECVYLAGHHCAPELRNEALMAKYLGPTWETTHFEVCCTCGRPGKNHGHYRIVPDGETSSLVAPGVQVNHWRCDQYNGGGGKEEMVTRLVGILTYLKTRIDSEEHLEDNAELSRQLTLEADKALLNQSMKDRAASIFEKQAWNTNSTIAPYKRFNAPRAAEAAAAVAAEEHEPIAHFDNRAADPKLMCMICLEERDDMYRPHVSDTNYMCGLCLYRYVCNSDYNTVTCELGCKPKKQIRKVDVQGLMDGHLCERMAELEEAEE